MATKQEMIDQGCTVYCLICKKCYKELPMEIYEDGHGGRYIPFCRCGSDLFSNL